MTTRDFQSMAIPASTLHAQLDGFTLRRAQTNIYATGGVKTLDTTVLDQPVTIRATPVSYTFHYGDGSRLTTKDPGASLPDSGFDTKTSTSHVYTETGKYQATVVTSYTGAFSVNGGPYQPIEGSASITSQPLTIDVWRTKHYRVAEPCTPGSTAPGCTAPLD